MQFTTATLFVVLVAVVAANPNPEGGETGVFYDANADVTCSSVGDEPINCVKGHIGDAPTLNSLLQSKPEGLDKRWCANWWCKPDCYARGYCNGGCSDGVCKCRNKKTGWFCFND